MFDMQYPINGIPSLPKPVKHHHHLIHTAMRNAFENIKVCMPPNGKGREKHIEKMAVVADFIGAAITSKKGTQVRPDWNASLSFKTFKALNGPVFDVPAHKVRMPYDRMIGL